LSVGGNDIREILGDMSRLPQQWASFNASYPKIVDEILSVTPNLIIVLQYRPNFQQDRCYRVYEAIGSLSKDSDSVGSLNTLMEIVYPPIFQIAQEKKLPLIDLSNTFDIYDEKLYSQQIEPSSEGGMIIAQLIQHVVKNHNFNDASMFYQFNIKEQSYKCSENNTKHHPWHILPRVHSSIGVTLQVMKTMMEHATARGTLNIAQDQNPRRRVQVQSVPNDTELENKVNYILEMGIASDRKSIIDAIQIDGSIETAVTALLG